MKISVCTGSGCRMKGSQFVLEDLERLVSRRGLQDQVEVCRSGCMGRCQNNIGVKVDGEYFSLMPSDVDDFFRDEILPRV